MTFAGWSLAQIATLFGVAGLAVTGLYLLRMRRRQVVVPFAALWERVTRESDTRRLWRRLRRLLSWLLQLAVLAAVALSLGDPRPSSWLRDPVSLAIVVDHSASMAGPAGAGDDGRRIDTAMARVRAELAALGPADRAVVVAAAAEVSIAAALGGAPEVRASLRAPEPQPGEADLPAALALARNAVAGLPGPRILVITDGALDGASLQALQACAATAPECQLHRVEGPPENVAITAFAARRYPHDREHVEVLTEISNLGEKPVTVVLEVQADGAPVGKRSIELAGGTSLREILPDLDAARNRFEARLLPPDGGTVPGPTPDDAAYAVVPPLRPYEVALITDGSNLFLEAALLTLDDHVRLSAVSAQQARDGHPDLDRADLTILDMGAEKLPPLPDTHVIVFDPWRHEDAEFPIALRKVQPRPFITEQDKAHPIMEKVVLKDVNIARGTTFEMEPGDQVLVGSLGDPLVVLREREKGLLALGFDPRQTDLPLRVAFPLFMSNAVAYYEQLQPGFVASIPVGTTRELPLAELGLAADGVSRLEVQGPGGVIETVPVEHGRVRLRALTTGFYILRTVDGAMPGTEVELAVNQANQAASDLHDRTDDLSLPAEASAGDPPAPAPLTDDPLWITLMLIVAGVVALEWLSYHRRLTV